MPAPPPLPTPGTQAYLAHRRADKLPTPPGTRSASPAGTYNAPFLALGLGATNMLAMLWTLCAGHGAVGVELRGDPSLGIHWNVREALYHQLGRIDALMLARYGEGGVPTLADGTTRMQLAKLFYSAETVAGDVIADKIVAGHDGEKHLAGRIRHVEFVDDRWKKGRPRRVVSVLESPKIPGAPCEREIGGNMREVLEGPSTWQAEAKSVLLLLRRYLEKVEAMDLARAETCTGFTPRVRLFTQHRVVEGAGQGFVHRDDGRMQVLIEEVTEIEYKGETRRVRTPGTQTIDLGVPKLFCIAQGSRSSDAGRLGFVQEDVRVERGVGANKENVVAQADYIAGLLEMLVDGRLRRRIASEFGPAGDEYWVRQIAVGHENDPEIGWVLVQVPDFMVFCPVAAGLVPAGTSSDAPEYFAAYQLLIYDYYISQAALILGVEEAELRRVQMLYGPKIFSLVEKIGRDARVATNGVVAGDSFGNGHFLTSAGAMAGMIGHAYRFLGYWKGIADGKSDAECIATLAAGIKRDTEDLLEVSAKEFDEAVPTNFGVGRGQKVVRVSNGGVEGTAIDNYVDAVPKTGTRTRYEQLPLNPSDWRRLFVRNGRVVSDALPPLKAHHPALQKQSLRAMM